MKVTDDVIRRALITFASLILILSSILELSSSVEASIPRSREGALQPIARFDRCGTQLEEVFYRADFQWRGMARQLQPMQLRIGRIAEPQPEPELGLEGPAEPTSWVAQIWSGNRCEAICRVQGFERNDRLAPVAMDMECQASTFSPLSVTATLLWTRAASDVPSLRMGTWARGYQHAVLSVKLDRFSRQAEVRRDLALGAR